MFKDPKRSRAPNSPMQADLPGRERVSFTGTLTAAGTRTCLAEISLAAAVFEDAVLCVQRTRRSATPSQAAEAWQWMASNRRDWPFAFLNICDVLGVDARLVRSKLAVAS